MATDDQLDINHVSKKIDDIANHYFDNASVGWAAASALRTDLRNVFSNYVSYSIDWNLCKKID